MNRKVVIGISVGIISIILGFSLVTNFEVSYGELMESKGLANHPFPENFRPFSNDSAFNMKIPANAAYETKSAEYMNFFTSNQAGDNLYVSVYEWSYPFYFVNKDTPTSSVKFTANWRIKSAMENVPIPEGARPDPEGDGHMIIIDVDNQIEYDFWQMKLTMLGWKASWGNKISLETDGVYPYGYSARGSGLASSLGVILPHELIAGSIDHALYFSIDNLFVKRGGPIRPASESDGTSKNDLSLPEGARIQLDPSIDINSLGLSAQDLVIARALQEYGAFLGDNGGGFSFYAANPIGQAWDWGDYFPKLSKQNPVSQLFKDKISINDFKVLTMGCQISETLSPGQKLPPYKIYTEGEAVENNCNPDYYGQATDYYDNAPYQPNIVGLSVFLLVVTNLKKRKKLQV